jgi:hypothetical protein
MRHIISYLAIGIALVAVVGVLGCDLDLRKAMPFKEPPGGVRPSKEVLIVDCARMVENEQQAIDLVSERLDEIGAVELIRIPGDINQQTLPKISAQDFERNGEPAFLVHIDYRGELGSGYDVGKLAVEVTRDGKIYGNAPVEPAEPGN